MARIVLLQCELEHRHQSPHLAMCLYATDLSNDSHDVSCALVHPSALDQAASEYAERCDLLVIDSIFPFALVRRLRETVGATTLVGGHSALTHVLRGDADLALVGPGRHALREAAAAVHRGDDPRGLPGTWYRHEDGKIDCGPPLAAAALRDELLPFAPHMDWRYFGPPRAPGSNLRIPSVIAELGCVYNRSTLADGGFYAETLPRLPNLPFTEAAARAIEAQFINTEGGCTFCTLRYMPQTRSDDAIELLLLQARHLLQIGARGLSLQSEHPLPYLPAFLDGIAADPALRQRCEELHIRTIPWLLLRHQPALERAIERCGELGIHLHLSQVGFEAFDDVGLQVFHKGISAADNRRAARLLSELSAAHPEHFTGRDGHGLILLHPWSTADTLRQNLAAIEEDAPWLLASVRPESRVEFYGEWTPLFWRAEDDGLLVEAADRFGWEFHFADPQCAELVAAWSSILARLGGSDPNLGAHVLSEVLRCVERHPDDAERRGAYLRLRDRLCSG